MGFLDIVRALGFFFTDIQDPDRRPIFFQNIAEINISHDRVLIEMNGFGVDGGTDIQQKRGRFEGREKNADAGTFNAFQEAQFESGRNHRRARMSRRHDRIGLAFFDKVRANGNGGVFFLANRKRGGFIHADKTAGMVDRNIFRDVFMLLKFGVD